MPILRGEALVKAFGGRRAVEMFVFRCGRANTRLIALTGGQSTLFN
jgi:hypothetical protein